MAIAIWGLSSACGGRSDVAADTCAPDEVACHGGCAAIEDDPANCGACGNRCSQGAVCYAGSCATSCGGGTLRCGQSCVDPKVDRDNCGACAAKCPSGQACVDGACSSTCAPGQSPCAFDGGAVFCANTNSDNANCGACGLVCPSGMACSNGSCQPTCLGGETFCPKANACVDLQSDRSNCGACDTVCIGDCIQGNCDTVAMISTGNRHTCAVMSDGKIACWGDNSHGELGDGTKTSASTPVLVLGLANAMFVAANSYFTCASLGAYEQIDCWGAGGLVGNGLIVDQTMPTFAADGTHLSSSAMATASCISVSGYDECWGSNNDGDLYSGPGIGVWTPAALDSGSFSAFAFGTTHRCSRSSFGDLSCRGGNQYGQLGNGTASTSPNQTSSLQGGLASDGLVAGAYFTCGLYAHVVRCWGRNDAGQLGNGSFTDEWTPTPVGSAESFVQISAGERHACGLTLAGDILCWGDGSEGQLGGPLSETLPTVVTGLPKAVSVAAGGRHTCTLLSDGRVACWGRGLEGQLGDGLGATSATPVFVE